MLPIIFAMSSSPLNQRLSTAAGESATMMHFNQIAEPAASTPEAAGHLGPACAPGSNTKSSRRSVCGRVLFVAYHFPPLKGGSGLLRSLKFCRYLPEFGWSPTVLSIHTRAYDQLDDSQLKEIPEMVQV